MQTAIPATQARQHFFKLLASVDEPGASVTITVEGIPKIVMMSMEEFEGWQETLEIMSDKKMVKGIEAGLKEVKQGKLYSEKEVKKILNLK